MATNQNKNLTALDKLQMPNTLNTPNVPRNLPSGTYYDINTGKKVSNPSTYTGTVISTDGRSVFGIINGQIKSTYNPLTKTTINANGQERNLYSVGDYYYYFDGKEIKRLSDEKQIKYAKNNEAITLIAKENDPTSVVTKPKEETSTSTTNKNNSSGGGGTPQQVYNNTYKDLYNEAIKKIEELTNPKPIGAAEAAKLYGIDYNEQNILDRYNEATNQYYDEKIAEQDSLRTNYARNNSAYYDQIMDSYVDSYANSAATASGKGTLAANALSTMLAAGQTNSDNDYGMLQNINNYESSRAAELANNPLLARQYYNSLGTYLSQLSANKHTSDVQQYVANLDAYSDMYSADRMYQAYQADAAASRYSGLAGAKLTKAGQTTNNVSDWQQMWNYYNSLGGSNYANQKTNAVLKDYTNSNSK